MIQMYVILAPGSKFWKSLNACINCERWHVACNILGFRTGQPGSILLLVIKHGKIIYTSNFEIVKIFKSALCCGRRTGRLPTAPHDIWICAGVPASVASNSRPNYQLRFSLCLSSSSHWFPWLDGLPACHTAVYSTMQTIQRQGSHKSATNSGECPICRKLWLSSCYGKSTLHFTAYPLHCVLPVTCKVPSLLISDQTIHLAHTWHAARLSGTSRRSVGLSRRLPRLYSFQSAVVSLPPVLTIYLP